jgi:hypothetical protein
MSQIIQVLGAIAILVAFALAQFHVVGVTSRLYLVLNFVGAVVLFVIALVEEQWGFVMLEVVWGAVSLWSLIQVLRGRQPSAPGV